MFWIGFVAGILVAIVVSVILMGKWFGGNIRW